MNAPATDKVFAGSVPKLYESHLVPLIFESYADDLARRVAARPLSRVLEIAAGTGVVTRELAALLPASVTIVATDLNQPMLDLAAQVGTSRPVQWRQADAMQLPFDDGTFDAVVCQFGVMFFPDKAKAYSEARRVLKPGGVFLFNVWDRIEENEFADTVTKALAAGLSAGSAALPGAHAAWLFRCRRHRAGPAARRIFSDGAVRYVAARSRAASARDPAVAYCQGTPLRNEIEARGSLSDATDAAERALRKQFGAGPVDGKIQAHVVAVER